jgi:peptide/nickel transport system substrate-binding protein
MLLAAIASVGMLLAAVPATAQVRGGTLRIAMDADNTTMDPHRSTAAVDRQVYNNIYSKLVDIDAKFGIVPQLAESWEVKGGGLVYVFKLRKGVKFHDGTDFNAEIVKWNFDRMRDPALASPRRSEIAPVKDVKVVDPYTVEITLSASYSPFLTVLTDRAGMMVSKAAVEKFKDDYARNPVGTGPFRFVEWVKDDHLTIKRFDGYWEKGLPYLDEVIYRPIPDPSVRFTSMRTGQVDFMHQIAPKDVAQAKGEKGLKVSEIPSLWWQGMHLNNQVAPFNNKALRQAAHRLSGAGRAGVEPVPAEHVGPGPGFHRLAARSRQGQGQARRGRDAQRVLLHRQGSGPSGPGAAGHPGAAQGPGDRHEDRDAGVRQAPGRSPGR